MINTRVSKVRSYGTEMTEFLVTSLIFCGVNLELQTTKIQYLLLYVVFYWGRGEWEI